MAEVSNNSSKYEKDGKESQQVEHKHLIITLKSHRFPYKRLNLKTENNSLFCSRDSRGVKLQNCC